MSPGYDRRRDVREQRALRPKPRARHKCISCKKARKSVLLVQALTPVDGDDGYEVAESIPICVPCLNDVLCPLAKYIADSVGDPKTW